MYKDTDYTVKETLTNKLKQVVYGLAVMGLLITPFAQTEVVNAGRPDHAGKPNVKASSRAFDAHNKHQDKELKKEFTKPDSLKNNDRSADVKRNVKRDNSRKDSSPKISQNNPEVKASTNRPDTGQNRKNKPAKVTVCHRTNSTSNPYVKITVSTNAVKNHGSDGHGGQHQGPVATSQKVAQELKSKHVKWGEIIPPIEGVTSGYNWNEESQAVYENGCNYVREDGTDEPENNEDEDVLGDEDNKKDDSDDEAEEETGQVLSATSGQGPETLPNTGASSLLSLIASLLGALGAGTYTWNRERYKGRSQINISTQA